MPAKKKNGRPTKFTKEIQVKIEKLARRSFTDVEIAEIVGIKEQTLNNWKKKHPKFFESLNEWKSLPNSEVERSLFERATGYSHPETKAQYVAGEGWQTIEMTKHYPPEATAMIFWLKNRRPDKWRDKHDIEAILTIEDAINAIEGEN